MAFPPYNLIINSSLPQQRVALQPSKQTVIFFVTTAMVTKPYLLTQQQQFRSTLIIFIYFSAAEFFLIAPAVAPMLKKNNNYFTATAVIFSPLLQEPFFPSQSFFWGGMIKLFKICLPPNCSQSVTSLLSFISLFWGVITPRSSSASGSSLLRGQQAKFVYHYLAGLHGQVNS